MDEIAETGVPWSVHASIPLTAMGDKPLLSVSNENKTALPLGNGTPGFCLTGFG